MTLPPFTVISYDLDGNHVKFKTELVDRGWQDSPQNTELPNTTLIRETYDIVSPNIAAGDTNSFIQLATNDPNLLYEAVRAELDDVAELVSAEVTHYIIVMTNHAAFACSTPRGS